MIDFSNASSTLTSTPSQPLPVTTPITDVANVDSADLGATTNETDNLMDVLNHLDMAFIKWSKNGLPKLTQTDCTPGLEISIRNRYRYSLFFCHRKQKFSTFFFHYRLGLFPTFSRGKSILLNRYFFSE